MFALPPVANPLVPGVGSAWLPPLRFGVKPYLALSRSFSQALAGLEARYPSHRPVFTLHMRDAKLRRKPK